MAESAESLFRRGMISPKQFGKLGAQKGTRTNPAFQAGEEAFSGRQGRADQGGRRDAGERSVAGTGHINNRRTSDFGTPARAGGKPSKGGSAPSRGGVPNHAQIDESSEQTPTFPRGAGPLSRNAQPGFVKVKSKNLAGSSRGNRSANDRGPDNRTPARARGGNPRSSGPQYGGPSSRADG
jgi:hypothetical protein